MMIKSTLLSCVLFLFVFCGHAQQDKNLREVSAYSADSLLEHSLQDYYKKGHYEQLLKELKIKKISCASGCDGVYADLVFTVSKLGKIVPVRIKSYACCTNYTEQHFTKYFYASIQSLVVPVGFAGKYYVYRFGHILKC